MPQPAQAACPPRPWLLADIGGTNARFGWLGPGSDRIEHSATLRGADHAGPAEAARHYLAGLQQTLGCSYQAPQAAALAVATAVTGDQISFTNSSWAFSRQALHGALGLQELLVLNDFEALALSLPRLRPQQIRAHGAAPDPTAMLAVLGPGTGLGMAGLLPTRHGWLPIAGEGGHATLAVVDDFEAELLAIVRREHSHVSAERLLSGTGLPLLHQAVAAVLGQPAPARKAREIVQLGSEGSDPVCARCLDVFCALLGSLAGNLALTLGARGGVYIGGGIVPRLGDYFFESRFRERFEAKGRFRDYLAQVPTAVILDTHTALDGAALALEQIGA